MSNILRHHQIRIARYRFAGVARLHDWRVYARYGVRQMIEIREEQSMSRKSIM